MIDTGHFYGLGGITIEDIETLNSLPKDIKNIHTFGLGKEELKILSNFPQLQKLEVSNKVGADNRIGDEVFETLQNLTQIEELALTNITIKGKGISKLSKLKSLYIEFTRFESKNVQELENLTELENLHLSVSELNNLNALDALVNLKYLALNMAPTKVSLAKVFPKLKLLECLCITIQDFIIDNQLENLHHCKKLKNLSLHRANKLTTKSIIEIGQLINLTHLKIYGYKMTVEDISQIKKLKHLQEIDFHIDDEIGKDLNNLAGIIGLKKLDLAYQDNLTDASLTAFHNHPNLNEVQLAGANITEKTIKVIASLTKLEELDISQCEELNDDAIVHLESCHKLKKLNISFCNITDQSLEVIGKLKSIKNLKLGGIKNFTSKGITAISKLTKLKSLSLSFCELEDENIISLSGLNQLEHLNLDGNPLTDKSIPTFLQLKYLKVLGIDSSNISEKGYLKLTEHPTLNYIYANGYYITDAVRYMLEDNDIGLDTRHGMD